MRAARRQLRRRQTVRGQAEWAPPALPALPAEARPPECRVVRGPKERLAASPCEEPRHRFVCEDHQLLDEAVSDRLALRPGALHPTVTVQPERDLPVSNASAPRRVAPPSKLGRDAPGESQCVSDLCFHSFSTGQDRLDSGVCETLAASNQAPIEDRLAGLRSGPKGTSTVTQFRSRRGRRLQSPAESASGSIGSTRPGTYTENDRCAHRGRVRPGPHGGCNVCDVNPDAKPVALTKDAQCVVEVPRVVRIDRERQHITKVDAAQFRLARVGGERVGLTRGFLVSLRNGSDTPMEEKPLEDGLDPAGRAKNPLDSCAATPDRDDDEVTALRVSERPRSSTSGVPGSKNGSPTTSFPRRDSSQTIGTVSYSCPTRTRAAAATPSSGRVSGSSAAFT